MNKQLVVFGRRAKLLALAVLASAAPLAHAVIDVDDVVTEISSTLTPIGLIGSAVLLVIVAIKAFKWVRRAM